MVVMSSIIQGDPLNTCDGFILQWGPFLEKKTYANNTVYTGLCMEPLNVLEDYLNFRQLSNTWVLKNTKKVTILLYLSKTKI